MTQRHSSADQLFRRSGDGNGTLLFDKLPSICRSWAVSSEHIAADANAVKDFESFSPWPRGQVVQACYVFASRQTFLQQLLWSPAMFALQKQAIVRVLLTSSEGVWKRVRSAAT